MHEYGTKTTLVFLPADVEASWSLLPSLVSLLSGSTVQPKKHLFQYPHGDRSSLRKQNKNIRINTNHSYDQRSSP